MRRLDFAQLMLRLSTLPGLSFLGTWLNESRARRQSFKQRAGDLMGYGVEARNVASEVGGAVRGEDEADDDEYDDRDDDSDGGGDERWEY